jgi:hypothetical protein
MAPYELARFSPCTLIVDFAFAFFAQRAGLVLL